MFCSKCGKDLPDGAKFCPVCGNVVSVPDSRPTTFKSNNAAESKSIPEISQIINTEKNSQRSILRPRNIIILIAVVCLISIAGVFAIRASNERALKDVAVDTLFYVFKYEITSHYDPLMPKPLHENGYEITYDKSDFKLEASGEPNSFVITGNFIVIDLISDGNPKYTVSIKSGVTSDFMRELCTCRNWTVEYEDPKFMVPSTGADTKGEYDDITGTYIDEYRDGFYLFIGYDDSNKQTAYLEVELVTELVTVELTDRNGNSISGHNLHFYPQATSPTQIVDLDYNPYDGSITATIYAVTQDCTIRFVPYPNAPYQNPFYVG